MEQINAVITGVGGYVPDYILTNDEISKMVDTSDEWIMGRIGIKERRILNEEGRGTSYMARKAAKQLMQRTKSNPEDIDLVIVATTTPDYRLPSTASILCERLGLTRAFAFDMQAVCSGFLYALETGANFIRSGNYKKIIVVGADKMSSIIDYTDRATCPIFGDGAAAFMLEPTTEDYGVMDAVLRTDGKGLPFLHIKAGGSVCAPSYYTMDNHMHYIYQEGRTVFKYAVANMSSACESIIERNHLSKDELAWVIPHQANQRIISAVTQRLDVPSEKVMVNIERYGNTSAATLPLCIWDFESKLKKGDKLIFTAFGAGFAWGAVYVKWGYDSDTSSSAKSGQSPQKTE
ncbi:beta-ketoacyl-ACP synthase III [Bacteroides stercorirosoris]|jgi:3-oxoacyl-[acyl-carrier-protein] synthase-3|uniref:Beta-ketoacyl-[acyl-carrier-protein] synthase III n=1 Tax=Bacteroides stercorirosoris TaxID=871324 RepID=A0A413H2H9_9BACE|nr:beta-ketoacyl-ACP synthase III [Bacteroides stercorirosoris]RGX77677.1 ketoacyl-ACP synthase III [Bacteroides stercorirosoris]